MTPTTEDELRMVRELLRQALMRAERAELAAARLEKELEDALRELGLLRARFNVGGV